MEPYYRSADGRIVIYHGDCAEVLGDLVHTHIDTVHAVVTSPPYAMQRADQYGGIVESEFPAWCALWLSRAFMVARQGASALINIREHIEGGQMSDYVHRTRLHLRASGFIECDELIWLKPDPMPVGASNRPRRSWERILWFSNGGARFVDAKRNGKPSDRLGLGGGAGRVQQEMGHTGEAMYSGIARCTDCIECSVSSNEFTGHPAAYPVKFAQWMVRLAAPDDGLVLDPFSGSGTTGIAAYRCGRRYIGIERDEAFCERSAKRLDGEASHLFAPSNNARPEQTEQRLLGANDGDDSHRV